MPGKENNNFESSSSIEKLLQDYSASRRALIGDEIKLSLESRRVLLAEAAKLRTKQNFWRLAFAVLNLKGVRIGAVAVALLIAGVLIYVNFIKEKEMVVALSAKKTESSEHESVTAPVVKFEDRAISARVAAENAKEKQTGATMGMSSSGADKPTDKKSAVSDDAAIFKKETLPESFQAVVRKEESETFTKAGGREEPVRALKSSHMKEPAENLTRLNQLFDNFRVEINGSNIVLTEADGSKYEGVVTENPDEITNTIRSGYHYSNFIANWKPQGLAVQKTRQLQEAVNAATTTRQVFFNVYGTNRSMKNYIEFSGRFLQNVRLDTGEFPQSQVVRRQVENQVASQRNFVIGTGGNLRMRSAPEVLAAPQPQTRTETAPQTDSGIYLNEPKAIIEGILTIGNITNIPIRAIMNQNGYFLRITNQ